MSVYDLKALDECADRMNAFGRAMSALLANEETGAQAAAYLEKSASRVFNFGHDNDEGMDYLDLYDFLSRLRPYLAYEQKASGNTEAAALYRDAEKAIRELLQVPFVAYRGGVYANSFIQEEEATYSKNLLPMDASGSALSGLWSKLGYDYLCGVTVYFPRSIAVSKLGSYAEAGIFPDYVDMLNNYLQITRSDEHLKKYADAAWKLAGNYSPIFQDMKVNAEDCTYVDKNGVEQKGLALRVAFNPEPDPAVTNGLDPAAVFIQTVKSFDVAVVRSQNVAVDEEEFVDKCDILIARSEALYPGEGMTGQVSLNEESGELTDTSGFAFDLRSIKINGRLVTYTDSQKGLLSDWGQAHPKEKSLETVLRDKKPGYSDSWRFNFSGLEGVVYTSDSGSEKQEKHDEAILIFGKDEEKNLYSFEGAVLIIEISFFLSVLDLITDRFVGTG